jgi:hypothetical protein
VRSGLRRSRPRYLFSGYEASRADVEFEVLLPEDGKLAKLFRNANWAHFLDPEKNLPSQFKGFSQVPATHFTNAEEQRQAVNRIVNGILGAIPN